MMWPNRTVLTYVMLLFSLPMDKCQRRYYTKEWRAHWTYSGNFPLRMYNLMTEHYEDVSRKIEYVHYIRFSYEEAPQYEMGYIMAEIIERYRKMVEHLKRPVLYRSEAVFSTIKRLQLIQMLYFEIYHLINMMHEIPRKYRLNDDLSTPDSGLTEEPFDNNKKAHEAQDKLFRDKEAREKKKKAKIKEMNKMRELILKGQYQSSSSRKPQNKWWPIDYGWEIDYYW